MKELFSDFNSCSNQVMNVYDNNKKFSERVSNKCITNLLSFIFLNKYQLIT